MQRTDPEDAPTAEFVLSPAIATAVAAELEAEVSTRDFQWHLEGVGARLAEVLSDIPELDLPVAAVLASEVVAADLDGLEAAVMARIEMAAARGPALAPDVVRALVAAAEAEPDRDLVTEVLGWIEGLEPDAGPDVLQAALVRAIAEDSEPGADPSLHQAVMMRIEAMIEAELAVDAPSSALIRQELAAEAERMQAARVVAEVQAEVLSIGPRLEREMPRAVQARIEPPTAARPALGAAETPRGYAPSKRPRSWVTGPAGAGLAGLLAAAAAVVLYLRPGPVDAPLSVPGLTPLHALGPRGEVHVDEIDYDGTVTVTESDGLAVIWLADASS